jgi:hypothetical protein
MTKKYKSDININIVADLQKIDETDDGGRYKSFIISKDSNEENGLFIQICS